MKKVKITVVLLSIAMLVGCAGNLMHSRKDLPKWYEEPREEVNALYGVGESTGDDLGLTRQDAQAAARDEIAQQMEIKISNLIIRSKQAIGGKTDVKVVRSTSKQIANQTANNIKIIERKVITKRNGYIVYALAKMPIESLKEQAKRTLERKEIQRQLEINDELQSILNREIEKMNGIREQ